MKLQTKKLIAREFILLIIVVCISLVTFLSTFGYNFYWNNKITTLEKVIDEKRSASNNLAQIYNSKINNQKWFYYKISDEVDLSKSDYNSYEELWKRFEEISLRDSLKIKFYKVWSKETKEPLIKIGFTAETLQSFIDRNKISKNDSLNFHKSELINSEITPIANEKEKYKTAVLTLNSQIQFSVITFLIFLVALFPLRYIFYGIKWSLQVLKQKEI